MPFAGLPAFIAGCIDAPNRVVAPISSWVHSRMLACMGLLSLACAISLSTYFGAASTWKTMSYEKLRPSTCTA